MLSVKFQSSGSEDPGILEMPVPPRRTGAVGWSKPVSSSPLWSVPPFRTMDYKL